MVSFALRILATLCAVLALSSAAAAQSDWAYSAMPTTTCREGAPAGIAVRRAPSPSHRIVIVMQGGGFCADAETCKLSPKTFDATDFALARSTFLNTGIFYRLSPNNPFTGYHQVYIPYCSGDLHAGKSERELATSNGPVTQHYQGWDNTRQFFERIVSEFASELSYADAEVMLVGVSAGGFGAMFNAPRLYEMLPRHVRLILVDDSAPAFDSATSGTCFPEQMSDYYGFGSTFLAGCAGCGRSNWLSAWQNFVLAAYPRMTQTLISSTSDSVISKFMTNGFPGCGSGVNLGTSGYADGLRAVRQRMLDGTRRYGTPTASFFISESDVDTQHVWAIFPYYYGSLLHPTRAQNPVGSTVLLRDWMPSLYGRIPSANDHVGLP